MMSRTDLRKTIIDRLEEWAKSQLEVWRDAPANTALNDQLERLEATKSSICLFEFDKGSVCLRQKTSTSDNEDSRSPEHARRSQLYLQLFRDVLAGFELDHRFLLAVDIDDHPRSDSGLPVFAFQKAAGSPLILLPDIDILAENYFASPDFEDPFDFREKADAAIFIGATTGCNLTPSIVESLAMPRLRAAVFFRDAPDVVFRLPKIVQYDTEETAAMVRALGVSGSPASWTEQFGYRFLLSMDGNGATCSRVAIALRSRSVLIKYESDRQLFYFEGLVPGENLLSVAGDSDVHEVLAWCRSHPDETFAISRTSRRFAREHLSRAPILIYVASLLDGYARLVLKQAGREPADVRGPRTIIDAYAHVQNVGDTRPVLGDWLGAFDGRGAIEGFALEPGPGVDPGDISYRAVLADGDMSGPCSGYEFCGTRGQNRGLLGFVVTLAGGAASDYALSYLGRFADGSLVGPLPAGTICRSPAGSKLTGLRLIVEARGRDRSAA